MMNQAFKRRVNIATCWASSRIAVLDHQERYEDSYAITEEFREWITCIEDNPHLLIALLHIDFDIHGPTKVAIEKILPRMPKGATFMRY